MSRKRYDVFLSYKSEDVHLVRRIAEALLANQYTVWFAEYQVLLQNYDQFQGVIDSGIRASCHGICFTNDRYVDSPYCRREIEQLLAPNNCGPNKILEIMLPHEAGPHDRYPDLSRALSIEHRFIHETLLQIGKMTGKPVQTTVPPAKSEPEVRRTFDNGRESYSLAVQGWEVSERTYLPSTGGDLEGSKVSRVCGDFAMWANLIVGDQVDNPRAWGTTLDDRKCYKYAIDFGRHYFFKRWWWRFVEKPVGLHLFFSHGFSHIGFTSKNWFNVWTRRYSVILPHPRTRKPLEFAFIFFFRGPFAEFCRYAYLMDELVESLRL